MNLMSALKSTPMLSAQSSPEISTSIAAVDPTTQLPHPPTQLPQASVKKSVKKKKEETILQQLQHVQQQEAKSKPASRKNVLVVPGLIPNFPGVTTIEAGVIEQQMAIKDEPIESVDPNVLLPQVVKNVKSPTLMQHLSEDMIKKEVVSPAPKSTKKGKGKQAGAEAAGSSRSPPVVVKSEPGQSGSVIKMLLNKPAQFSDPVVATQSMTKGGESAITPPKSEVKSSKKGSKVKKELAPEMLTVDTSMVKKEGEIGMMLSPGKVEDQKLLVRLCLLFVNENEEGDSHK